MQPNIPTLYAMAEWVPSGPRKAAYWRLSGPCPYCGRTHRHGGGSDPFRPNGGHAQAHCVPSVLGDAGYFIEIVKCVGGAA